MKLKNKKTGEIATLTLSSNGEELLLMKNNEMVTRNVKLSDLEEWEDCEEPKEHWCVTMYGGITRIKDDEEPIDSLIEIGNYFNSKENAYDAWDKLKAWKRLKDKGFEFEWVDKGIGSIKFAFFNREGKITKEMWQDIDLLFGGEE